MWRVCRKSRRTAAAPTSGSTSGGITGPRSRSAAVGNFTAPRSCFCPIISIFRALILSKASVPYTVSRAILSSTLLGTKTSSVASSIIRLLVLSIQTELPCTVNVRCLIIQTTLWFIVKDAVTGFIQLV